MCFDEIKSQSATDKKLNALLEQPLNAAREHIDQALSADWKTHEKRAERKPRPSSLSDSNSMNLITD
jgi:hypothetical protein